MRSRIEIFFNSGTESGTWPGLDPAMQIRPAPNRRLQAHPALPDTPNAHSGPGTNVQEQWGKPFGFCAGDIFRENLMKEESTCPIPSEECELRKSRGSLVVIAASEDD